MRPSPYSRRSCFPFPALAQDNTDGLYIGAGFGDFSAEIDEIDDVDDAIADFDEDESASKYFFGYRFNRFLGVQADLYDLGDAETTLLGQSTFVERFNLQLEYELFEINELDDADARWLNASWRF